MQPLHRVREWLVRQRIGIINQVRAFLLERGIAAVVEPAEADKVLRMLPLKYPEQVLLPGPIPNADQVRIFRVTPPVISVLDYSKGFGHTDLVTC